MIIDNWNIRQYVQDGFFKWDIQSFNEKVVREAILNAVCHRDYRHPGSVFIKQYPERIIITSPGGLPIGVTPENILTKQVPRNRRIAEVFAKCGLVERSNQGTRLMFKSCILESKALPDYSQSDETSVVLNLFGRVEDPRFISYLNKIGEETLATFSFEDFLILDSIRNNKRQIKYLDRDSVNIRTKYLLKHNVIERPEKGKRQLILSMELYSYMGDKGTYTRKKGLDEKTNKALLIQHITTFDKNGSRMKELMQVLPDLTRAKVYRLLKILRNEGNIIKIGNRRGSLWFTNKQM